MTKEKVENAFARLDKVGLGKDGAEVADAQESTRRADFFKLVTSASLESILY